MSKRHQNNRRKTYGRRQHELAERRQRDPGHDPVELALDGLVPPSLADRFAFLELRASRLHFALGD